MRQLKPKCLLWQHGSRPRPLRLLTLTDGREKHVLACELGSWSPHTVTLVPSLYQGRPWSPPSPVALASLCWLLLAELGDRSSEPDPGRPGKGEGAEAGSPVSTKSIPPHPSLRPGHTGTMTPPKKRLCQGPRGGPGDGASAGCGGALLGRVPEPQLPCASSSAHSCPPDPPPAGSASHSSHAEGGSAAPPAGQRRRQIREHQAWPA